GPRRPGLAAGAAVGGTMANQGRGGSWGWCPPVTARLHSRPGLPARIPEGVSVAVNLFVGPACGRRGSGRRLRPVDCRVGGSPSGWLRLPRLQARGQVLLPRPAARGGPGGGSRPPTPDCVGAWDPHRDNPAAPMAG